MECLSYARVSSDEQAEKDLSIPAQFKAIRKWAESKEYQIVKEFSDEESAHKPAVKRPGFMEMIAYCRKNKVKMIIVHKLDRFSRNRMESLFYKDQLRKYKVTVKSVCEDFDPSTPHGHLFEGIIEVFNEWFIYNLSMETTKGMKENAERGQHNGGKTPYGFAIETIGEGDSAHSRLVPGAPDEIENVRLMYRLAVEEGLGGKTICRELNRRKIPPISAKGWTRATVIFILNNPVNVGDLVWRRRISDTPGGAYRASLEHEQIVVPNAVQPIIDRETWDRWKQMASARRFDMPRSVEGPAQFLLARLIKCGHCGGNYLGRRNKYQTRRGETRYRIQYNCSNYQMMGPEICPSYPLKADLLEGIVLRLLRARLGTPAALGELETIVRERILARRKASEGDPKSFQRRMEEVERKIGFYYKAIGDGLDTAICQAHIKELSEMKVSLQKEVDARKDGELYSRVLERSLEEIRRIAKTFESGFYDLPVGVQRRMLLHFVEGMEVQDKRILLVRLRVPADTAEAALFAEEGTGADEGGVGREGGVVQYGSAGLPKMTPTQTPRLTRFYRTTTPRYGLPSLTSQA